MADKTIDKDETPTPTSAWRESSKKAIIPEVNYVILHTA